MDTDELSQEAYRGIFYPAEKFDHDLTLQFGMLSYECETETEYLEKAVLLVKEIREAPDENLNDIFFGRDPVKKKLYKTLDTILSNIEKVKLIPESQRISRW